MNTLTTIPVIVSLGMGVLIALPAAAAGKDPVVTVATFNHCKVDCAGSRTPWATRQKAVVRTILALKADVVAVQEADASVSALAERLRPKGYVLANTDDWGCSGDAGRCVADSFLFYRASAIEMAPVSEPTTQSPPPAWCAPYLNADAPPFTEPPAFTEPEPEQPTLPPSDPGYEAAWAAYQDAYAAWLKRSEAAEDAWYEYEDQVDRWWFAHERCAEYRSWKPFADVSEGIRALSGLTKSSWPFGVDDRGWSYAYLRDKRTSSDFVAVSVHLPNEKTPAAEQVRVAAAEGLVRHLRADARARGLAGIPIVVAGDLNSFQRRQPRGAQRRFTSAGFTDAYDAGKQVNGTVPTVNMRTLKRDPFPPRPHHAPRPARLDYIFVDRGRPEVYEVFLRLRKGRFDDRYRPSDHNPVKARLRLSAFRAPTP